jgi:glutaredoxin
MLLELAADVRILGRPAAPETVRLRDAAAAQGFDVVVVDVTTDSAAAELEELGVGRDDLPVVVARDGTLLRDPGDDEWRLLLARLR